jgi:hypothetical protein
MATQTRTKHPWLSEALTFPQPVRVPSYEEVFALVPYKRVTTRAFGLEYVTAFHMKLLLQCASGYTDNMQEFSGAKGDGLTDAGMASDQAVNDIYAMIEFLRNNEVSNETIQILWNRALELFREMHKYGGAPEWEQEFNEHFEKWKRGELGM